MMKSNLRKILCIFLACCLLLVSCQSSEDKDKSNEKEETEITNFEAAVTPADVDNEIEKDESEPTPGAGNETGEDGDETPTNIGDENEIPTYINQVIVATEKEQTGGELYDTLIVWPTVYMPQNPDVAERINQNDELLMIHSSAREAAASMPENADPEFKVAVSYSLQPTAIYSTASALSITFLDEAYYGGTHPLNGQFSLIFDTETGELLSLYNLLDANVADAKTQLSDILVEKFNDDYSEELYYSAEEVVDLAFDSSNGGKWSFTDEGLQVTFSPYEVSYYAAGYVIETVPYNELTGILDKKYFPESYTNFAANSAPSVETADELGEHSIEYGTFSDYALVTSGDILNVSLCDAKDYGDGAYSTNVVFYANVLTDKDYFWIEETDDNLFVVKYTALKDEKLVEPVKVITLKNGDVEERFQ